VEVYTAILLLVAAIALYLIKKTWPGRGVVAAAALALAAAARLGTEPMRLSIGSTPAPVYMVGVVLGVALVAWRRSVTRRRTPTGGT